MSKKTSSQIRNEFLDYFAQKEHAIVDSAPVVPKDDPTLLFTNAGMNQFKSIFLGEEKDLLHNGKKWSRAADTQKCIRVSGKHNDLEEVGHDTYHHTLFEMLGNWSFGDYFKKEAIGWAWELLTEKWGLNPDRMYATVFEGDEEDGLPVDQEAIDLWKSETNIDPSHILKYGKKDNFWEMGDTGPCGPCSEIHYDLRPDEEREKADGASLVNMDDPRVMEIWNLVFIQFNRLPDQSLEKLPAQHVDTGMGFERICAVLQDKKSNYDTDVFTPLLDEISSLSGFNYGDDEQKDIAMRVIADHIRAVTFSIADGASPGNDGRGYVIRRILRRAVRYGWDKLGFREPFMHQLLDVLSGQFEEVFPEIKAQGEYIRNVIRSEEKSFIKTLGQGIELFHDMVERDDKKISGDDAFKLHDTYGFPIDLTQLMAREQGLEVDIDRFNELMDEQKERARAAGKFSADQSAKTWVTLNTDKPVSDFRTEFIGYDALEADVEILAYSAKEKAVIFKNKTPFYAESGGQVGDTGKLIQGDHTLIVKDVQKGLADHYIHYLESLPDNPEESLSGTWKAMVDRTRRKEIAKHHSATHLVHAALRNHLGEHVAQKGSLVAEDHLRFDFSHFEALTNEELESIEKEVNRRIQENISLKEERDVPIDEAKNKGAMMLFGEKYGERVRMITFDDNYSKELCGGTHVNATGEIGYFRFTQETSVAAGVRRIEAVCGKSADELLREEKRSLNQIKQIIGKTGDLEKEIERIIQHQKDLEKELERVQKKNSGAVLDDLIKGASKIDEDISLISGEIPGADMNLLKQLGYEALEKLKSGHVVILGSKQEEEGKVYVMAAVTDDLIKSKDLKAGALVGKLGRMLGGGGGGQPNLATAGGKNPGKLNEVLDSVDSLVKESIS